MGLLSRILAHPLTRGLSVDDPRTTYLRRKIIHGKPFLRSLYCEWYRLLINALPKNAKVLELGSGAGFFADLLPNVIASEIFVTPGVDLVADARQLPLPSNSLDAIVMTDVFHHIPDACAFLTEAGRCIRPGGKVIMIEPWCTRWSEWIYTHLHSEPFEPDAGWTIPDTGPLSGANGALPWIVFERDLIKFNSRFPQWRINRLEPMMPISYILSGGVSMRSLVPGWSYRPIRFLEALLPKRYMAMFAFIELELQK